MQLSPEPYDEDSDFFSAIFADVDEERLRTEQLQDKELKALLKNEVSSLRLRQADGIYMLIHNNVCCHYTPQPHCKEFPQRVHNIAHRRKRPTVQQLAMCYVWPAMKRPLDYGGTSAQTAIKAR